MEQFLKQLIDQIIVIFHCPKNNIMGYVYSHFQYAMWLKNRRSTHFINTPFNLQH